MIICIDTSTPTCRLTLSDGAWKYHDEWLAGYDLAEHLLEYIEKQLNSCQKTWDDITAIAVMKGPGSFTGLRISCSVFNTLADARNIPIVGETGVDWQTNAVDRLSRGDDDAIVLPEYGRPANVTSPKR